MNFSYILPLTGHILEKESVRIYRTLPALYKKIDFLKLLEKLQNTVRLGGSDETNAL